MDPQASGAPASRVYCTYFDSAYLARGIVMLLALRHYHPGARITVLALDDLCARVLRDRFAGDIRLVETRELHDADPVLPIIRQQRTTWAYYMTQTPSFGLYAMNSEPRAEAIVYVDADLWFFRDPSPLYEEVGAASVALSPHRFHSASQHLAIYGQYNGGFIYWRNDETGRRCLADWRDDCLEWCDEQPQPDGRFLNQGYMTRWPERYAGVRIVQHPGSNLAPWNIDGHLLAKHRGSLTVDGQPLLFYHFSGLNRDARGWYSFYPHPDRQRALACKALYRPYLRAVEAESRRLQKAYGNAGTGTVRLISEFPTAIRFKS